jgi:hypothetical protein
LHVDNADHPQVLVYIDTARVDLSLAVVAVWDTIFPCHRLPAEHLRKIACPPDELLVDCLTLADHVQHQFYLFWRTTHCGHEAVDLGAKLTDANIELLALGSMGVLNCVGDPPLNTHDGWCACAQCVDDLPTVS